MQSKQTGCTRGSMGRCRRVTETVWEPYNVVIRVAQVAGATSMHNTDQVYA